MPQLLPAFVLAQALGIVVADRVGVPVELAAVAGLVVLGVGALLGRWPRAGACCAVVAAACAGALSLSAQIERSTRGRPERPFEATVEATVARVDRFDTWSRVDLDSVSAAGAQEPPVPERIRVTVSHPDPEESQPAPARRRGGAGAPALESAVPGDRVRARLRLRPPGGLRNPGGRDRERELARAGIGALASPVHPALHVRLPGREGWRPLASLHRGRARAARRLTEAGPGGALLRALALGDRGGLGEGTRDAFARLGLAHLLAVSGLHLALVASGIYAAARRIAARCAFLAARADSRTVALAAALAAASVYGVLAGFGVPVRRALLLMAALAAAVLRGRPARPLHPLCAAGVVVLAVEPQALFAAGAQLSFAATGALLLAARAERRRGAASPRSRPQELLRTSAVAIAATAPIAATHFGAVAPAGLAANLIGVPLSGTVLLPAALLAGGLAAFAPDLPVTGAVIVATERLARATLNAIEATAAWAPPVESAPDPALPLVAAAVAAAFLAIRSGSTRARVGAALAGCALLAVAPPAPIAPPPPRLIALDVGQGDATLIQGRSGALLVDAGRAIPGGLDLGRHVVLPALAALGVPRLDLLVVTHGDVDHRGGVPSVIEQVPIGAIWLPPGAVPDPVFAEVIAAARRHAVPLLERGAGDPEARLGDLTVTPLWPPHEAAAASHNEGSLVLRVEAGGRRILLPGDLEAAGEAALLRSRADLRAGILKLAHHGSRTSSTAAFLAAIRPRIAVASAPCAGHFGMPHPQTVQRVARAGATLLWTGRDGALRIALHPSLHARGTGPRRPHCTPDAVGRDGDE